MKSKWISLLSFCLFLNSCKKPVKEIQYTPIIVGISETRITPEERKLLERDYPVGVILYPWNCANEKQVRELVEEIHRLGILVAIDIEGKSVNCLQSFSSTFTNKEREQREQFLKRFDKDARDFEFSSPKEIYDYYFEIARYVKSLGIDIIFSPVTDVASLENTHANMANRSFSDDPQKCAQLALKVVQAYQDNGIIPAIKHLPGHGKVQSDTHWSLPFIEASIQELKDCDFKASRLLIEALKEESRKLPLCLTAHIVYKAIDPIYPATLSKTIIQEVIRGEIGIGNALVLSDCCSMYALDLFPERYKQFFEAGGDIIIRKDPLSEEIPISLEILKYKSSTLRDRILKHRSAPLTNN